MNGIDGSLGTPSKGLDARPMSTGAKAGESAGAQADGDLPADFGSHLAGLASRDGKVSDSAALADPPGQDSLAAPQQGFLLAAGTVDANRHGASGPETAAPEAHTVIAHPQAGGETRDARTLRARFAIGLDEASAMASASLAAAMNPGYGRDSLAKRILGFEGDASLAAGDSVLVSQQSTIDAARNAHALTVPNPAATMTSPLMPGFSLPCVFTAASEVTEDVSNRTAASANPVHTEAASVSNGVQTLLPGLPSRSGAEARTAAEAGEAHRLAASIEPPPEVEKGALDTATTQDLEQPHSARMQEANGGLGSNFAASVPVGVLVLDHRTHLLPADGLSLSPRIVQSRLVSARDLRPGDIRAIIPPLETAPVTSESAVQDTAEPPASHAADPNGGGDPDFTASAPIGDLVLDRQTYLPAGNRPSPARRIVQFREDSAPGPVPENARCSAVPIATARLAAAGARESAAAQETAEPPASHAADPYGGGDPDFTASAPIGDLVLDRQYLLTGNRPSPALIVQLKGDSAPGPAPENARGIVSPIETASRSGESADDGAATQGKVEFQASRAADPGSRRDLDLENLTLVKGLIASEQTYAAPPNGLTPAHQIAKFFVAGADLSPADTQASGAPGIAGVAKPQEPATRVQTMQLQLDPESLGKVIIRMRLSGSRLDLRVETERPETMQLIGHEKDLLVGKLQAAGFAIESLVIQTAEPQTQAPFLTHANGQNQSSGQFTGQANGGPSAHDRSSTQDDRRRPHPRLADDAQDGTAVRPSSGDLYL